MGKDVNILIVDDFGTLRRIIRNALRMGGYDSFTESEDGRDALKKLEGGQYDLILSDWNMKDMGGLELLKAVRSNPELRRIPFLMITAEGAKEKVLKAIQGGVNGYIIKPFTPEMLLAKISKIMES